MSSTNDKRNEIKQVYKSKKWAERVEAMSEEQVLAVYLRLKRQKVIKETR
jgi:hypothetical protein